MRESSGSPVFVCARFILRSHSVGLVDGLAETKFGTNTEMKVCLRGGHRPCLLCLRVPTFVWCLSLSASTCVVSCPTCYVIFPFEQK